MSSLTRGEILNNLKEIVDHFPIDTESPTKMNTNIGKGSILYKIENSWLVPPNENINEAYLIDTPAGELIACQPNIVGDEFRELCLKAAKVFVNALKSLDLLDDEGTAVMNLLRAGLGYMVGGVLPSDTHMINIRAQYVQNSYRDHGNNSRNITISYMEHGSDIDNVKMIIIPDTFATGRSSEISLTHVIDNGYKPDHVVLYGFISIPALIRMSRLCRDKGIKLSSFAICDLSQLSHNSYDMCVYGPDEGLYSSTREYKALGSVIGAETLKRILPIYIPGLDQPGDWSERQTELFNGYEEERGDIKGHLKRTITIIEKLEDMCSNREWYRDYHLKATREELKRLNQKLSEFK
jgi:hypothetical protein